MADLPSPAQGNSITISAAIAVTLRTGTGKATNKFCRHCMLQPVIPRHPFVNTLVRGRHGFRASVILTLFQGHVEERRKATSSSSTYYGPHAAMHTRSLFVFCCYGCRALSSERVRSQLHHAIVNDHDWLASSPRHELHQF